MMPVSVVPAARVGQVVLDALPALANQLRDADDDVTDAEDVAEVVRRGYHRGKIHLKRVCGVQIYVLKCLNCKI